MMLSMAAMSIRMSSQRRMLVTIVGCAHRIWVYCLGIHLNPCIAG